MKHEPFALDYASHEYAYVERPNSDLVALVRRHVLGGRAAPRILDIGCGCGANARAIRQLSPAAEIVGVEPNARAAELSGEVCARVVQGDAEAWLRQAAAEPPFDAVILSDVIEHVSDPVGFLRRLAAAPALEEATWIISVPNYGVWYNRVRTLLGRFEYRYSGLYDRTHLRFFTRRSIARLLEHLGFEIVDDRCSPSLVQSTAPVLRKLFDRDVERGDHLALTESPAYRVYRRFVEPVESGVCQLWPELLGFQIISVARRRR